MQYLIRHNAVKTAAANAAAAHAASQLTRIAALVALVVLTVFSATGCDYSVVDEPKIIKKPGVPVIAITPVTSPIKVGDTYEFKATVTGTTDTAVVWSIDAGPGRIYPDGMYLAPRSVDIDPTSVTIRASAHADTSVFATATITLTNDTTTTTNNVISLSISPTVVTLRAGGQQQFVAMVSGSSDQTVTWTVVSGSGNISLSGVYSAPSVVSRAQGVIVQASSLANPAVTARATITLQVEDNGGNNGGTGGNTGGGTNGGGNNGGGNSGSTGVCFEREILPIFRSNCAMSGCHDPATRRHGLNFTTYAGIVAGMQVADEGENEILEKITEERDSKRMPPPPQPRLTSEQITLIRQWVSEGTKNTTCSEPTTNDPCDTLGVSFSTTIRQLVQNNCLGCHTSGTGFNKGVELSTYLGVRKVALTGQLLGAVSHSSGYTPMPFGGQKLLDCQIAQIRAWINKGAAND